MVHQNEMIHTAQDDLFQQLEAAQQDRLHDEVQRLGHHAKIATDAAASENTPLIVKAGRDVVSVDNDLDLEALDRTLQKREEAAAFEDQSKQPKEIASEELLAIFKLSVPLTGSKAIVILPAIMIGWMLGNVGGSDSAKILAASSLSDFFLGQVALAVIGGISSALSTVCTQTYGAKQFSQLCLYGQVGMIAVTYSVVIIGIVSLNCPLLLKLLGQNQELADLAGVFVGINTLALPFTFSNEVATSLLRSQHIVTPLVLIPFVSNLLTLPLAYTLGYCTGLGYVGILIATDVNEVVKFVMLLRALLKSPATVYGWSGWRLKEAHALMVSQLPLGLSSILLVIFQASGINLISIFCGYLPDATESIASSNIASNLMALALIPFGAISNSGAIRAGTAIGAGNSTRAAIISHVTTCVMVFVAVFSAVITTCLARSFSSSYTTDPAVAKAATALYPVVALLVVLLGWMYGIESVFRAIGKQWFIAKLNFLFLVLIGIPLGLVLAFSLHLGAAGLFIGELIGMLVLNLNLAKYANRLDWEAAVREAYLNTHPHMDE